MNYEKQEKEKKTFDASSISVRAFSIV